MLVLAAVALTVLPMSPAAAFDDVPKSHWAHDAIQFVATTHNWMRDYGTGSFRPRTVETRKRLARALVRAFAPSEPMEPSIRFEDLPSDDPFYRYANVAAKLRWMRKFADGTWRPDAKVRASSLDQALVLAMGLRRPARGLAAIHQEDGDRYRVGRQWPHMVLARALRLHYDHSEDALDLQRRTPVPRDEVAYSLWRAKTVPSWLVASTSRFEGISLPAFDESTQGGKLRRKVTQFALDHVGRPYIWGGEWSSESPSGYCCGYQPQGGMDCSGFMWFVLKRNEDGYNAAKFRDYSGWSLPQRSSSSMAQATPTRIKFGGLRPGNLMFFASNGGGSWSDVDHVGMYAGNGWMIHSTDGGPQITWVGDGWYRDNFVWGRRVIGSTASQPASLSSAAGRPDTTDLKAGEPPAGPPLAP